MRPRVLLVDDDPGLCELLDVTLSKRGFDVIACTDPAAALDILRSTPLDVVVTDLNMPGLHGTDLCARVTSLRPDLPVIVITAFGSLDTAVAAIRSGAYDFVTKPFDVEALALALRRAAQHRALRQEVKVLRQAVASAQAFEDLIGQSPAMRKVYDLVARVAETDVSVLITGESGTGKELVARAIHQRSARHAGPFVAVNCSALPEMLLESELFGHIKGAFTDARAGRKGLFLQAQGGTLFLDEIGEMPIALQPKLLRALQERRVRPVGGDAELPFDVRVVTATNRDLEDAIAARRFREDLFFRINVVQIHLPPLRSRGSDIALLAQHFVDKYAAVSGRQVRGLSPRAVERLLAYPWPGNVRELQNCIERAVALTGLDHLCIEDLPEKIRASRTAPGGLQTDDPTQIVPIEEMERRYILHVLDLLGGNKVQAAQLLGLDRRTLYRKLERYSD